MPQVPRGDIGALAGALTDPRFEVIPLRGVEEQVRFLPAGAKVTITCSPRRGIGSTVRVASELAGDNVRVVPHLAARLIRDRAHLEEVLDQLAALGVREIFVVGGDSTQPVGPYPSGLHLLRAMAEAGAHFEEIGIPAYPEPHPLIDDVAVRRALHEKQPFATYMVTQMCFDARVIGRWLAAQRKEGITLPAYIGLPGAVDSKRLIRMALQIGVGQSVRYLTKNTGLAGRLLGSGYRPSGLLADLARFIGDPGYGIRGLHLNTFNQVENTEHWRQEMLNLYCGRTA
jgi:methylenetetrahydrofolate reductase (NADPH)